MRKILLSVYSISFSPTRKPDDRFQLDDIAESGQSAAQILGKYIKGKLGQQENIEKQSRTLTIDNVKIDRGGELLHGMTQGGEYGFASSARDVKTGKPAWNRTVDHSEIIPFYYCLSLPMAATRGVMVLQKFGQSGIKDPIVGGMKEYVQDAFPGIKMIVRPLAVGDVLAEYLEHATCSEVTLISTKMPHDRAEQIQWIRHAKDGKTPKSSEERGTLELSYKANKLWKIGGLKGKIQKIRSGAIPVNHLIETNDFVYDQASVTLERGGQRKKFLLSKDEFARTYLDVTDDCNLVGGHPKPTDIHREALKLIDGLSHLV